MTLSQTFDFFQSFHISTLHHNAADEQSGGTGTRESRGSNERSEKPHGTDNECDHGEADEQPSASSTVPAWISHAVASSSSSFLTLSNRALIATITVERDIRIAPTSGERMIPAL